jgi:hypothetical protein
MKEKWCARDKVNEGENFNYFLIYTNEFKYLIWNRASTENVLFLITFYAVH